MINISEINHVKSTIQVIRYVTFEFDSFNIDQMEIFKDIISIYLLTNTATFYRNKARITNINSTFTKERLLNQNVRIYEELINYIEIEFEISWKPNKLATIYIKAPIIVENVSKKHIIQCLSRILKKIRDDIYSILLAIENAEIKENYFTQDIPIWNEDFSGQYDFNSVYIDFGPAQKNRTHNKIARCWIKYKQYRIDLEKQPTFSFIERTSTIILTLLQCFLRFPIFNDANKDIDFIPSNFAGKSHTISRSNLTQDYLLSSLNNNIIPHDIAKLFSCYNNLSPHKQNIFFNAATAYIEGLKRKGSVAISYYVIAIETLSCYEAQQKGQHTISKIEMIYNLLDSLFPNSQISLDTIEKMYQIRSAYVHNGISNNDFLDEIFMKSSIDNKNCKKMERIANYALVEWIQK